MEYCGLFAFFICIWILSGPSHPSRVKELHRRVEALERKAAYRVKENGVTDMSRLMKELEGKWCIMDSDELDVEKVRVCDVDEEWVKVEYKKAQYGKGASEKIKTKLIRVNSIDSVEIVEE